jgi:1,2-diacylglycerol 3-alpha-glucosyltransferase
MRICHFTNTFLPHVGGVARAVQTLLEDQRRAHHRVLVVAPEFAEGPAPGRIERSVERIPAITHFNDSDFSVRLPIAAAMSDRLANFRADLLHAHHPFLLGDTALREAASRQVPIIFTHHTLYERYTHYLPFDSEAVQGFAAELATRFANRCSAVIAPSASVRDLIVERGVTVPVHVVPTGVDTRQLARGDGARARRRLGIPADAAVIGHLGRLAEEKNLPFLADAVGRVLAEAPNVWCLIVGDGPAREAVEKALSAAGDAVRQRVVLAGKMTGTRLHDACAAMDVFAFASHTETQGLVLAEAMAAGVPVVALDASGVREVVRDHENGRLLPADADAGTFAAALKDAVAQPEQLKRWQEGARQTAATYDRSVTAQTLLQVYAEAVERHRSSAANASPLEEVWDPFIDRITTEVQLIADKAGSIIRAFAEPSDAARDPARV